MKIESEVWRRPSLATQFVVISLPVLWVFCFCSPPACAAPAETSNSRPNVVLILTDDQGYGDLGSHGNDKIKTPNLDRLAAESVEFTQFYCCPNCSPTRASLLTGRYNYRTGVTEVSRGRHFMYADEVTLAEVLQSAGYRTGIFGKWHLGDNYPMRPTDQGFDEALVHKGGGIGQAAGPPGNTYFNPILEHNNRSKQFTGYCNDLFTDAALAFIEENRNRPFFVYLASNLPHFPLQIGEEYVEPYRKLGLHELNAKTYGMITNIDDNVGRLLAELESLNLQNDTIVLFLSDNGPRTRRTKNDVYPDRYNAGLRGTKTSVYENGIRVPFFLRWPGRFRAGRKVSQIAAHLDVLPTLLEACGIPVPEGVAVDGVSLMPLLLGETDRVPDRRLFFQWHNGDVPLRYVHFTVRSERYKLIQPQDNPHGIRSYPSNEELQRMLGSLELYDIRRDPSEIENLASRHPERVNEMLAAYEDWFRDVTSERPFVVPQRIHLGTPFENPTTLSQFDWRGVRSETGLGHWEVHVANKGDYAVTLRFAPAKTPGEAHLRFRSVHVRQPIEKGATSCRFSSVHLDEGDGRFESYLKFGRNSVGVDFVDVERSDPAAG